MKQYLLLLKSSDFNKSGNIWLSNPINLYANSQYTNFSYVRSGTGLNLIGDRVFVGTEVASPSAGSEATPITDNAVYVTDYGEVVYDSATPSILRFVDTSSRIDVLSYRHIFTNIPGTAYPTFNLQIYESDDENGPWLKSVLAADSNAIFLRDCKPYVKIELEINGDGLDLESIGLVFYLEIGIYDPIPNTISTSAKNILRRFPSWTYMYEDSVSAATPELATPKSVGGKFVNALVQESLDSVSSRIDYELISAFISTADLNQLAWCYVVNNVNANINTIFGDDVELARVSSLNDFLTCRSQDYVFFYSPISRQVLTLRNFNSFRINDVSFTLEPINVFNDFDEFGARVGLPRLYLESNDNYRKRILDVSRNPNSSSLEGFKKTLRRELDLWRAYGSTPNSDYLGATPIVLEISDIESSSPYFDDQNNPTKLFRSFVDDINEKYPFSLGYVKWGDGVWDAGGLEGDGLGRLSARYDASSPSIGSLFQNGVGDFADFKLEINPVDSATTNFSGMVHISGLVESGTSDVYSPIIVDYLVYSSYRKFVSDYEATKANIGLVYELDLPPHSNYSTPSTFYANINYNNFDDMVVGNRYLETSSASPEFNLFKVFDQEGLSVIQFRDKEFDSSYSNSDATPASDRISVYDVETIRVVFSQEWDASNQEYDSLAVDGYRFTFNKSTPEWVSNPVEGSTISFATPDFDGVSASIKVGSNTYALIEQQFNTKLSLGNDIKPQMGRVILNSQNQISLESSATINTSDLVNLSLVPPDANLDYIYVDIIKPGFYPIYPNDVISSVAGGVSYDPSSDQNWLVPSSPNIVYQGYDESESPVGSIDYFESATINYSATPSYLLIESASGTAYPFEKTNYITFNASTTPEFFAGYIDKNNNTYKSNESMQNVFFNQDTFLDNFNLNIDSFNLDSEQNYIINNVFLSATPNSIVPSMDKSKTTLVEELNVAFVDGSDVNVGVSFERDNLSDGLYNVGVNPGWLYLNGEDYFYYKEDFVDSATGSFFEFNLSNTPRSGYPVQAKIAGVELRNVAFEDSATPGKLSFWNTESVQANRSNVLYIGYENVSNVTVIDSYTGELVDVSFSLESNKIINPNLIGADAFVPGRIYNVEYYVNDAFYVDKDIFNSDNDQYSSKIYFSSTPSDSEIYSVMYESSADLVVNQIDLDLNQIDNPLDEGFIYVSKSDYSFDHVEAHLSPTYIADTVDDYMILSIVSYDDQGNLKPNQSFHITGSYIESSPEYITTNSNGLGVVTIRYNGPIPSEVKESTILIEGLSSSSQYADPNSDTESYLYEIDFRIQRKVKNDLDLRAVPVRYNITSDALSTNSIVGRLYWQGKPFEAVLSIRWAKARTLYDLFEETGSFVNGSVLSTKSDGSFEIVNEITSADRINPGYWFAKIELVDEVQVEAALNSAGKLIELNEITISGDVIYWHEEFDNVHFTNEYTPLPNVFTFGRQIGSELIATPNFIYRHYDQGSVEYMDIEPNWVPPRWVPLRMFDQYQMGLLGSTPNYVDDYSLIHPDSKEN